MIFQNAKIVGSGIDPEAYHRTDIKRGERDFPMGRSALMEFARCPSRWIRGYKSKDTDSTEWGDLMDCLALSRNRMTEKYSITPEIYPAPTKTEPDLVKPWNWNATYCKEWRAKQNGATCITPAELYDASTALDVLRADDAVDALLSDSATQVLIVGEYRDGETGIRVPVKALIDLVPDREISDFRHCLADFKTSFTADGKRWARLAFDRGYHVQAAFYLDLFNAATGEERESWLNVVQENFPPYEVASPIPLLSQEFVELGRMQYQQALRDYCRCLDSGEWPSYAPTKLVIAPFQIIEPEPWMVSIETAMKAFPKIEPITTELADAPEPFDVIP